MPWKQRKCREEPFHHQKWPLSIPGTAIMFPGTLADLDGNLRGEVL
jgi:hypothetical protein